MKVIAPYFPEVLFLMLYIVGISFETVDEILGGTIHKLKVIGQ